MTTLAYDKPREFDIQSALASFQERSAPVVATDIIYNGAAVGRNSSGNAAPLTQSTADFFLGFAYRRADNAAGAAGDVRVDLAKRGFVVLPVTGVDSADDVGKFVTASDDDSFTAQAALTGGAGLVVIGKVHAYIGADGFRDHGSTHCWVHFEAHDLLAGGATLLTTA